MTAPLRVGLVGLGSMGRNHLRNLSSRDDCVLTAVADQASDLVAEAVAQTGAAGYADGTALISDAPADAVVIAAPTTTHSTLALAAIERGLPVLVEKPLAATVEEGLGAGRDGACQVSPSPGRSHRALQPGGARAGPAARAGLGRQHLLDREPSGRTIPSQDP